MYSEIFVLVYIGLTQSSETSVTKNVGDKQVYNIGQTPILITNGWTKGFHDLQAYLLTQAL